MWFLKMKFSDGSIAPEKGVYKDEPALTQLAIPATPEIKLVQVHSWLGDYFYMYSIALYSEQNELIAECKPNDRSSQHHRTQYIQLQEGERIVAARIGVNEKKRRLPVMLQLLVYDLI